MPGAGTTRKRRYRYGVRSRVAAALVVLLAGCATSASRERPHASVAGVETVRLTPIVTGSEPIAMAVHPGDNALYVAERAGVVRPLQGAKLGNPALDIRGYVTTDSERGLLGLTFSPDGRWIYVHYSNRDGDTRVGAYRFANGVADTASYREILAVKQPFPNHNGGELTFGPDNNLYLGLGDGGSQRDPDNNAQRLDTLLGKILRINPTPLGPEPYTIPPGNPFVGGDGARPEIWTYGLRNPWRFSFDRMNNDLWIGDVGQDKWEEIDWRPAVKVAGTNFGWNAFDASHPTRMDGPRNATAPIFEYSHDNGCSVVGGYVYRGKRIASLQGLYIFGDYCAGKVRALQRTGDGAALVDGFSLSLGDIVSFGQDATGEIYVLSLTGAIARIDPA